MERLKINQFYGAPTAIRLLMKYDKEFVTKYDRYRRQKLNFFYSSFGNFLHVMQIVFENAGFRRRAHEPGSLELVQQPGWRGQMRSSGHMVAEMLL